MAIKLPKFEFFNRLDARARIFFLFSALVAIILIIYLGTRFFFGGGETTGATRVATTPPGLQSVQGGTLTPEYYRALVQANTQLKQQAEITGGSALPTVINTGQPSAGCIICSDETSNIKNKLDDWVKQGNLSPETAAELQALADKNVSPEEFASRLQELVKQGKLTPEQARQLLEEYRKQHKNRLLGDSAKIMDNLIKAGQLPVDAANQLLTAQKNAVSPADYAAQLQEMVRQGKITPALAQQLLAQYTQQRAREITNQSIAILQTMAKNGELTPEVATDLIDQENRMVPIDFFAATLNKYISAGKLVPAVSDKVLAEYRDQKAAIGPGQTTNQLLQKAEAAAYGEISDLLKQGKITADVAQQLTSMLNSNIPVEAQQNAIAQLVQQKKLTPEIAQLKIADYKQVKGLRDLAQTLAQLQGNNVPADAYANALRKAVQDGLITPEQAAQLMQEYQASQMRNPLSVQAAPGATGTAAQDYAQLQQRIQQQGAGPTAVVPSAEDFAVAQTQATQVSTEDRMARMQALMAAMSGQASQLVGAWQPPTMVHVEGTPPKPAAAASTTTTTTSSSSTTKIGPDGTVLGEGGPVVIKAGTILFGVLDTAVNSDYPDSPVMVTIVDGPYKGSRLMGKLITTKSVAGQMDRVSLNFQLMNRDEWPKSKTVTAYAIDPDTARTVMASDVNYHYLLRFGAIMATSFLQGYATAITTSSSTSTTGIFGTSTTHPELDPRQKIAVGLGQVGQTLGNAVQNYVNIPPTVRVDSGVGLGILFMADVT